LKERLRPDWDPRSDKVLDNQIAAYDEMRQRCPVAHSEYLNWSVFRHGDVVRVLDDHETFSSAVSAHLSVPNGMDPPEHTEYRRIVDSYFTHERMTTFEHACRQIAVDLVERLPSGGEIELNEGFARVFALRVQRAFLAWPKDLHEPLRQWVDKNQEATLASDEAAMAAVALEFDIYIKQLLAVRREAGTAAPDDITTSLLRERVGDRLLQDEEIVSILRNWTVGELSTIAASVGILVHYLAAHPEVQQQLRERLSSLPSAIDEILRIHAPLISNRRIATKPVEIGGRRLRAGERVTLIWASANRDEAVFGDPDEFRLDREPSENLLYGAGVHVCPGAPLARLELRVVIEELLERTDHIGLVSGKKPLRAAYPASGFSSLPLWIR
jgi:cytochrome P450